MICFFVPGTAKPAGSKTAFINKKTGKAIITDASGAKGKSWRQDVKTFAWEHRPKEILTGAIGFQVVILVERPKSHYGTGRNSSRIKDDAPKHPIGKPDVLKLARAIEDALTGIIWKDDAQIVDETLRKGYSGGGPGAWIRIWEIGKETTEGEF